MTSTAPRLPAPGAMSALAGGDLTIRPAHPEEAAALSALAFRSKAHWGYDAAFMEACRADLTVSSEEIARQPVYVLEGAELLLGFYTLRGDGDEATLTDLFLDPAAIGRGHGRRLWQHAVETARRLGCATLVLHSEPQAEGFYRAMGAVRVGDVPSNVFPGRMLPLMRIRLA